MLVLITCLGLKWTTFVFDRNIKIIYLNISIKDKCGSFKEKKDASIQYNMWAKDDAVDRREAGNSAYVDQNIGPTDSSRT
jgi:predicted component of type VI protein secretion system